MGQPDRLELALAELESIRTAQDAELDASFAPFADLGATIVEVDIEHLRRLSECSECTRCEPNVGLNRSLIAAGRC